jgi:hypothetical protein
MTLQTMFEIIGVTLVSSPLFSQSINTDSVYNASMAFYKAGKFNDSASNFDRTHDTKRSGLSAYQIELNEGWIVSNVNEHGDLEIIEKTYDYFGQLPPADTARIFAPDVISLKSRYEQNISFSPDGKECILVLSEKNWNSFTMLYSQRINHEWCKFDTMPFSKNVNMTLEPFFTSNGKTLYFTSNALPSKTKWDGDTWRVDKRDNKWGKPERLSSTINQPGKGQWFPTLSDSDNLYFIQADTVGWETDIYTSAWKAGAFSNPVKLDGRINSEKMEWDALIAKDESYLIFVRRYGDDTFGGQDLYISFKNDNGDWTKAKHLGKEINTELWEQAPTLSPDGRYLFFGRLDIKTWEADIFWIDISFIEKYRDSK